MVVDRVVAGKMLESRILMDGLGMIRQLEASLASAFPYVAPARSNDYGNSDIKVLLLTSWGDGGIAPVDVAWKRKWL